MRLHVLVPQVKPDQMDPPSRCVDPKCQGRPFRFHPPVSKARRETVYHQVQAHRYPSLKCKRTFRVYPPGVSAEQTSLRVKGLAVMLYLLGLSYGATALAFGARGVSMGKSRLYDALQEAASRVPGLGREQVFEGLRTPARGAGLTTVKCQGECFPLGIRVDAGSRAHFPGRSCVGPRHRGASRGDRAECAACGSSGGVTDEADGLKTGADEVGVEHQVCKAQVVRHPEDLIERLEPLVAAAADGSLRAMGVRCEQAAADLPRVARTGQESATRASQ